jgi:hypothetical protein
MERILWFSFDAIINTTKYCRLDMGLFDSKEFQRICEGFCPLGNIPMLVV